MKLQTEETIEKGAQESNQEATERIQTERLAEKKLNERKNAVMSYFFELTGIPMSEEQFLKYNKKFSDNRTPDGYNLKSFIRDEKVKKDWKVINSSFEEFCEDEGITETP